MATDPPPPRSGLSLYANLLDPSSKTTPGTISSAPVTYNRLAESSPEDEDAAKKQQALAASLRFQPTKRPQLAAQKAKAKAIANKFSQPPAATAQFPTIPPPPASHPPTNDVTPAPPAASVVKSNIADWATTASDDEFLALYGEKRQRGGRKKRKKNRETQEIVQDWDDIYDPSRPNSYEEYKNSEEKIREVREWKDVLYRHRMKRIESSDYDSDASEHRPLNRNFAPPQAFAPPPNLNDEMESEARQSPPPPQPAASILDDATGENAYARRMRLSQQQHSVPDVPPPPPLESMPEPKPPPTGQISRAPVRYSLPLPPEDLPSTEAELAAKLESDAEPPTIRGDTEPPDAQPRSNRPGQAGFAERLLSKYGWTKGSGLGAQGTGIINPLYAKVDKRKKLSDAEGGGFATPASMGKIMGGNKSKQAKEMEGEGGKFGAMSEVIRLERMLIGIDIDHELTGGEDGGGIMQEIGEECSEKYGAVERVYVHRPDRRGPTGTSDAPDEEQATVFVAFVSQLSALRAVNALEGRVFNGNVIAARFWPKNKFDAGLYI